MQDDITRCGNYIVYNTKRGLFLRSGMAEVGILRRWTENVRASIRCNHAEKLNRFYSRYPDNNCNKNYLPKEIEPMGRF